MRRLGIIAVLTLSAVTLWSTDMFGWGKRKSSLTGEWAKAEEIAVPWVAKNWKFKPTNVEPYERWPYMLRLGQLRWILVHNGKVIDQGGGIDALAEYLKDIHFLDRKDVDTDMVLEIVQYFDAYGPDSYRDSFFKKKTPAPTELHPRLEMGADGLKLILHYHNRIQLPNGAGGGRPEGRYYLDRWTLTIPRDYKLTWKSEYVELPRPKEFE
jgi:hypothetical protein